MAETIPTPPSGADWYTAIPKASADLDSMTQRTLDSIQENMERLAGIRGEGTGQALITASDLLNETYLNQLAKVSTSVVNYVAQPGETVYGDSPPPPTNLHRVTYGDDGLTAPWFHHIEWDNPSVLDNVYYIEVWSSTINDVGTAQRVAIITPPKNDVYIYGILLSVDYYYWIRSISYGFKPSTWVPNPDTQGGYLALGSDSLGETIDGIMRALAGETPPAWDSTITYNIGDSVSVTSGTETRKYRCILESTNNEPPNTTYWERFGILMTGEVDGVSTVAIDGNLVVDGTIIARNIAADAIEATHIKAGAIVVEAVGDTSEILNVNQIWGEVTGRPNTTAANIDTAATRALAAIGSGNEIVTKVIPASNVAPSGSGLYLGADYLGFYNGSAWRTYFDSSGNMSLVGSGDSGLTWNGALLAMDGGIRVSTTGYVRTYGKTSYSDTDAGFWLGYDSTAYKLYIGDSSNWVKWTGSSLDIKGSLTVTSSDGITIESGGNLTIESGGGIDIESGGDITLQTGGDLILQTSAGDESQIYFDTATNDFSITAAYTNNYWMFNPVSAGGQFRIGMNKANNAVRFDAVRMFSSSYSEININSNGLYLYGTYARPLTDSSYAWGSSSYCFSNIYADAGVTSCSDRKWKKNVKTTSLGLKFINALDFIEWEFDSNTGKNRKGKFHGMLAQDVLATLEDIGYTNNDFAGVNIEPTEDGTGENWGLVYEQFVGPLGRAIQEEDAKVEALKLRITQLEKEIEVLKHG